MHRWRSQPPKHFNSQPREGGWPPAQASRVTRKHFNSQPREGGWASRSGFEGSRSKFQLTAARRRLALYVDGIPDLDNISTHSRAKAAGVVFSPHRLPRGISTHSRAKAAGQSIENVMSMYRISTHSRAKAAGIESRCHPVGE